MHGESEVDPTYQAQRDISSRIFRKVWQDGRYALASKIFTEDCLHHFYDCIHAAPIPGPCGYIWIVEAFRNALTDLKVTYDLDPSGEVVHWSLVGVGVRPLLEVSLPEQKLELGGNEFYRFSGDKITETWSVWNIEGCLKRLAVY